MNLCNVDDVTDIEFGLLILEGLAGIILLLLGIESANIFGSLGLESTKNVFLILGGFGGILGFTAFLVAFNCWMGALYQNSYVGKRKI